MPATVDHWAVLGLKPGADAAALKRAFRAQARRWHPDLNGNDPVAEERFKQVNEAYAVLSDPGRRRAWEAGEPERSGGEQQDPFASGFPDFELYLDQLFGRRRREAVQDREGQQPGPDHDGDDDGEAEPPPAQGPAAGPVTAAEPGRPPTQSLDVLETLVELTPEQALEGSRLELDLPDGLVVEVWTPPLAGDGWRLRLAGLAPGGGDHFLQLRVITADGLRVDGLRVLYTLDLSPAEAALGCRVVVPTLQGAVKLHVPPGSSSGRLLRLRGRGLARGGQRGDQLVELRIVMPDQPSEAELALYRRLQELVTEQQ
ncbi:MAG: DnaJ C-terminal domain-containing protein [Cyanobium sp.]